jgi:hypothetical protein
MSRNAEPLEELSAKVSEGSVAAIPRTLTRNRDDGSNGRARMCCIPVLCSKKNNTVGEIQRLFDVMGDEEDGCGLCCMNVEQEILHRQSRESVESPKGLIEKENAGVARERSSKGCPLGHPTGNLARSEVGRMVQLDEFEQRAHSLGTRSALRSARKPELHVPFDRTPGQKAWLLESNCNALVNAANRGVIDRHGAGIRVVEARDLSKKC